MSNSMAVFLTIILMVATATYSSPIYSSNYYNAGTVGLNPMYHNVNSYYNYMLPPHGYPQYINPPPTTTTTTTEETTTTAASDYDFSNLKFLCTLTGNWNLQVDNGWLQMHCMYDYFDLLNLIQYTLPYEGFLETSDKIQHAWRVSGEIFHRDGYVPICTRYCDVGYWPMVTNANGTEYDHPIKNILNIGCTDLRQEECEPICQEEIKNVKNGFIKCSKGLFYDSECQLHCDFGYNAGAVTSKTCNSQTAKWSHENQDFTCTGYSIRDLLNVAALIPEADLEQYDLTDTSSILQAILTHFLGSNKTISEISKDPHDLGVKNAVLKNIVQAYKNSSEPSQIVLKSLPAANVGCGGAPNKRIDCGYPGITEDVCLKKENCCWDSTVNGVPWCFHKSVGDRPIKDSTTKMPFEQHGNVQITSRSPNPLSTFGTMGGGEALLNLLRNRLPGNPTYENGFNYGRNENKRPNRNNNNGGLGSLITNKPENFQQSQCKCSHFATGRQLGGGCPEVGQGLGRIICGMTAVASDWPWHTVVYYKQRLCGGTLIASNFVITAAHCLTPDDGRFDTDADNKLYFGVSDITNRDGSEQWAKIKAIHRHPSFHQTANGHIQNDIAVIELVRPVKFTQTVRPICLTGGRKPTEANGHRCYVSGFGKTGENSGVSKKLQYAELPIVESTKCLTMFNADNDASSVLCAGSIGVKSADTCRGDSGGPLFCTTNSFAPHTDTCSWYLAGVTSFGQSPCGQGFPGVYTSIGFYERWIKRIIS